MYSNLTPDLARAKLNERLARAEARRLAAGARQARPGRPRTSIPTLLRLLHLGPMTYRPAT
jgi:hypothetical protein